MMNIIRPNFDLAYRNAEHASGRKAVGPAPSPHYGLSPREFEVSRWLVLGKTNPEIAIILGGSVRTIEKHIARIIEKVGAPNRTAAALILCHPDET